MKRKRREICDSLFKKFLSKILLLSEMKRIDMILSLFVIFFFYDSFGTTYYWLHSSDEE
jgi:hypothetical protein